VHEAKKEELYDAKHCCPNRAAQLVDHSAERTFGLIFGLIALVAPGITLLAFIYVFAAYALVDGGIAVITAIKERELLYRCGWILFEGILSILALAGIVSGAFGMILFFFPGAGIFSILWLVGIYGIVFGLLFIVRAFQLRPWASSVTA